MVGCGDAEAIGSFAPVCCRGCQVAVRLDAEKVESGAETLSCSLELAADVVVEVCVRDSTRRRVTFRCNRRCQREEGHSVCSHSPCGRPCLMGIGREKGGSIV